MAVAYDALSFGLDINSSLIWTHIPVGTPAAIALFIQIIDPAVSVLGAQYGGVLIPPLNPNVKSTGEAGQIYSYVLGNGVPAGNQAIAIVLSASALVVAYAVSVTAAKDVMITGINTSINSDSVANPTGTLALGARSSFVVQAFISGQDAATGITPLAGWTNRNEFELGGTFTSGIYTYDTVAASDVTIGWTQTADDAVGTSIALTETFYQGGETYGLGNPYNFHYGDERSWETSNNILVASPSPGIIPGNRTKTILVGGQTAVNEDYDRILNPAFYGARRFRPMIGTTPLPPSVGGIFPVKRIGVGIGVK